MVDDWTKLWFAALGGGITVKVLDIVYLEVRRRLDKGQSSRKFVDEHLDPLLKAADEVVGKLCSLAREDFKTMHEVKMADNIIDNNDYVSLVFLISKLWAHIEIIRRESVTVSLVKDQRGKRLQQFMDCMEGQHIRLVDRITQRAVGELMLRNEGGKLQTLSFIEFIKKLETDSETQRWTQALQHTLLRLLHTTERQRLLQFGSVVHALTDTLDPKHEVTKLRPSYPRKLSVSTLRNLRHRIFEKYLDFVPDRNKYLGPPKRRP